jgi:hypothetical protein
MRAHGQTKLGFYPLPPAEANRLRSWLNFQEPSMATTFKLCLIEACPVNHLYEFGP